MLADALPVGLSGEEPAALREAAVELGEQCATLESQRRDYRESAAGNTAADRLKPDAALAIMDAYRWLERSAHHAWRVTHHLDQLSREAPTKILVEPREPD